MNNRAAPMNDGGFFGRWEVDDDIPEFVIDPYRLPAGAGKVAADPGAAWHHAANDSLTAVMHLDGHVEIWRSKEGLVRLTSPPPHAARPGWHFSGQDTEAMTTRLGAGYASWEVPAGPVKIRRTVWLPRGDVSALRIDLDVSGAPRETAWYFESFFFDPLPIAFGAMMSRPRDLPPAHGFSGMAWSSIYQIAGISRRSTDAARRVLGTTMRVVPGPDLDMRIPHTVITSLPVPFVRSGPLEESAWIPRMSDSIAVATTGVPGSRVDVSLSRSGLRVDVGIPVEHLDDPDPDQTSTATIVIATGSVDALPHTIEDCIGASRDSARAVGRAVRLHAGGSPTISREASWHAAMLSTSVMRDDVMGCRFVPQGSAYTFIHGIQGAPRDYAITAASLCLVDPALAADLIRTILYMTREDGAIEYAHTGAGKVTSAGIHPTPSDLPLFLLWCLTEYLWTCGSSAFLSEEVVSHDGTRDSVAGRALAAWAWFRRHIGTGPHGLVRVGSGDWSDPISLMVKSRRAFHHNGESMFNTAMAAYVLPRAAMALRAVDASAADEMDDLSSSLRAAAQLCWTGEWFLRGYDGLGSSIGDEHLFLDSNAWCLIAGIGDEEQRATLCASIGKRCDDPSPVGATVLDRPHSVRWNALRPGWDCNGGVWAAINAFLTWGYAQHDIDRAWRLLDKQSLAAHARAYPGIWYGVWSGPDAYNSYMGDRPGETFVQPATPMTEWPAGNSNAHAGPLLALVHALGIRTGPDGVTVENRVPADMLPARFTTPVIDVQIDEAGVATLRRVAP